MTSYSSSPDVTFAFLSLFTAGMSLFAIVLSIIFSIAIIIACCYPYYRMAKNAGIPNPWLAFIPIANLYIMLILPRREFNIFNWIKTNDRVKVFWYSLCGYGLYFALTTILSFLAAIPFVGVIFIILLWPVSMLFYVAVGIFTWRINYDILMTYGMEEHAMWASIVGCFVPFLTIVFGYIIMDKEPNYNV